MGTRLIVYWTKHSMSAITAKRAESDGVKKYKSKQMKTEFPETMTPEAAINQIIKEHGERPDQNGSVFRPHAYAEIRAHTYAKRFTTDAQIKEKADQLGLT